MIISSKLNPFFRDEMGAQGAMHNVHSFYRSSRDLAFLNKILQGKFEWKSSTSKTFRFFSNKVSLDLGISSSFHRLYHLSKGQKLGKNNSHVR